MYQFDREAYEKRVAWFRQARLGMFIHWGLYALPARGEWVRSNERMPLEDYQRYFDAFTAPDCDPRQWAQAAKAAGMRYMVFTAKHHDGFCLFDSKLTDYTSVHAPCHRDFVAEYVTAAREAGLKVGLYYSLLDWRHPDYPHFGDRYHPMRDDPRYSNENRDFSRYLDYLHGQVRELCTNYGKIDLMWFDFSYDNPDAPMRAETWRGGELVSMVRALQPDILIDNRLEVSGEGGFGSLWTGDPGPCHGDFACPEQLIPPEGIRDRQGRDMVWEACVTMNNNWGYTWDDGYFKPADMIIRKLVECVSKGGNLLLNVGPDGRGQIPRQSLEVLEKLGAWMAVNGESVYGCGKAELPKPEFGRFTRKGNRLYCHIYENSIGPLPILGIREEDVAEMRLLSSYAEVPIARSWVRSNYPDLVFADLGPDPVLPDPVDTVLEITLRR